jgi:prepilin-type N-terminal cleavage/methylation domain-containing protein
MKRVRLSSKIRKACQGSSSGFTLIEVLIALALVGIIAIAFLSALSTASIALITTDERATAESLARSQMEYVKNLDYDPAGNYTAEIPPEYEDAGYSATIDADELQEGLQKITVIVSRDDKEVITLEDYKRLP